MEAKPVGLGLPSYESLGFSLPPPPPAPPTEEEEFVDEAARQEDEDARIARELLEREEREAQKRVCVLMSMYGVYHHQSLLFIEKTTGIS